MKTIKFVRHISSRNLQNSFYFLIIICSVLSCSPDDRPQTNNPYLPQLSFRLDLNLSLPQYNNLNFPGNSFVTYNYGLNGIVVYNINNNQYTAFELSDPNHPLTDCSKLTVQGIIATCSCRDGNAYNIITGEITQGTGQYSLKPYRIRKSGNILEVYN